MSPPPRRLIVTLGALSTFGPVTMDMYLPGLPAITRDLSSPAWVTQLTLTACMVGLAVGQLLIGPISDALGRRRPQIAGLIAFCIASALCALAPDIWVLVGLRFVQGVAGAASLVIARAIVRDLFEGVEAARVFALLALVSGLAPVLAPVLGGQLLRVTDWRGIFVVLTAIGGALLVAALRVLRESLPAELRQRDGLGSSISVLAGLLRERSFVGATLAMALSFAAMTAYIAASPFVLEERYGVSAQLFSAIFAVNAAGILIGSHISARLVTRLGPRRLLSVGVRMCAAGGCGVAAAVASGIGLAALLPCLFVVVASMGLIGPNATALGLAGHPSTAGSASALMGLAMFGLGAMTAPIVGVAGSRSAVPMAVAIAVLALGSLASLMLIPLRS